ncbi:MAG TPA: hypothetical protein VK211_08935 [Kamptonema sp.]|nr:hypothetical protein [Kamptonema sp.]
MKFALTRNATTQGQRRILSVVATILTCSLFNPFTLNKSAQAETLSYCKLSPDQIQQKENLRKEALTGKTEAVQAYFTILTDHAREVAQCRNKTWPQTQAIWLRLYPCDARPGEIDRVLDQIVNKGYNQVYLEAFYDGQVLLPVADNPTAWPSVIRTPGYEKFDILAKAIAKGKQRGLKVYTWSFTMNFGYTYAQRPDRQEALARNGQGQTTLTIAQAASITDQAENNENYAFIDPYSPQARQDYSVMVNQLLKRRPNGMLFDYVRYLRGVGSASVITKVQDLWIYGKSSQEVLLQRAQNQQGRDIIQRYLARGFINLNDVQAANKLYPKEKEPLWPGRIPLPEPKPTVTPVSGKPNSPTTPPRKPIPGKPEVPPPPKLVDPAVLQNDLWQLTVGHAVQGILEFLGLAIQPAQRMGLPVGAVFFPDGNRRINTGGFDSRLQPWDRFPSSMEFHAMSYGSCGDMSCIIPQVQRVMNLAPQGALIIPAIAGGWGQPVKNRPSLEIQMQAIHSIAPQINAISHFSYGWQEPQDDRQRRSCRM